MRQDSIALLPQEVHLTGRWVTSAHGVEGDETCRRIEALTSGILELVATDESGWDSLYQDKADGRLWELYYPDSGVHGGGPPSLRFLRDEDARFKYKATGAA